MSINPGVLMLMLMVIITVIATPFIIIYNKMLTQKNKKRASESTLSNKLTIKPFLLSTNTYVKLYRVLEQGKFTEKRTGNIRKRLREISSYNEVELQVLTVEYTLMYIFIPLSTSLIAFIIFKDLVTSIITFYFSNVIIEEIVTRSLNDRYLLMLDSFTLFISRVTQQFAITGSPLEAIQKTPVPPELAKQIADLENLLESGAEGDEIDKFLNLSIFRLMKTFGIVCYLCNDSGDSTTSQGGSVFSQALAYILQESQMEIRRLEKIKRVILPIRRYLYLYTLSLPGLSFLVSRFVLPATAILLYGTYGFVMRAAIFSYIVYLHYKVVALTDSAALSQVSEKPLLKNLLDYNEKFKYIVRVLKPKKERKIKRDMKLIRDSLTDWTVEYLTAERIYYFVFAFLITNAMLVTGVALGKNFEKNNYKAVELVQTPYDEATQEKLVALDQGFVKKGLTEEEIRQEIVEQLGFDREQDIDYELRRIQRKKAILDAPYYSWWMYLTSIVVGLIFTKFPEVKLKSRVRLIADEEDADALQLQTLIQIVMFNNLTTMELLEWMSKTSTIHKGVLNAAYHEYASDAELSLARLSSNLHSTEMKRLVENLKTTIEDTSIEEAFYSLSIERSHIMMKRQELINENLERIINKSITLVNKPIFPIIIGVVIIPIGILAVNMGIALSKSSIFDNM